MTLAVVCLAVLAVTIAWTGVVLDSDALLVVALSLAWFATGLTVGVQVS